MSDFRALIADTDTQVFARLGGLVTLCPADGSAELTVLALLKRPRTDGIMRDVGFAQSKPQVHMPYSQCDVLKVGAVWVIEGRRWRCTGAPTRSGRGTVWVADVEDLGAA